MMGRTIAKLRIEDDNRLFVDLMHDDGQVYNSQVLPPGISQESAQRIVNAMNHPEDVIVLDDFPPQAGQSRIRRTLRLQ